MRYHQKIETQIIAIGRKRASSQVRHLHKLAVYCLRAKGHWDSAQSFKKLAIEKDTWPK